jgi:hypothetical protein
MLIRISNLFMRCVKGYIFNIITTTANSTTISIITTTITAPNM